MPQTGRNSDYADAVASDIYARTGGGWLTAKQTALIARNADHTRGAGNRSMLIGTLYNPDGDACGEWEVHLGKNGCGLLKVSMFGKEHTYDHDLNRWAWRTRVA